jgi:hypothetical protein
MSVRRSVREKSCENDMVFIFRFVLDIGFLYVVCIWNVRNEQMDRLMSAEMCIVVWERNAVCFLKEMP